MRLAAALLLAGYARHYGWAWVPPELAGVASKGLGAALSLLMIGIIWRLSPSRWLLPVAIWLCFEDALTALCSIGYAIHPWAVPPGVGICSAWAGFDLGAAGLVAIGFAAWGQPVTTDRA